MKGTHVKRPSPRPEPPRLGVAVYKSEPGGKPLRIGMNVAKKMAARMDIRDRATVHATFAAPGKPLFGQRVPELRAARHHQRLVKQRHGAIHDREDAYVERQRLLREAPQPGNPSGGDQAAGDTVGAVPQPPPGSDAAERHDGPGPV